MILDLPYFMFYRFAQIDKNGGYFTSRLKRNMKPEIDTELHEWPGHIISLEEVCP